MDVLTPEQRHRNMVNIKNKDSQIELRLRKALWHKGYRYRKNYKIMPGKPDIALTKYRIAIFCDSEYFHGKDWEQLLPRLQRGNNADFWIKKISRNIERDKVVNKQLEELNWKVLRFWGNDIKKDLEGCLERILEAIREVENAHIEGSECTDQEINHSLS